MGQEPRNKLGSSRPTVPEGAELGRRIRRVRLERGLTLRQLEQSAQLSATHLSDIERGRTSPTLGALIRIARALDRKPSYFVERGDRSEILHLPPEACRTFSPAVGVTVEVLTLGIPGSRMLAYRVRLDPGAHEEIAVTSREVTGEGIYLVRKGMIESDLGRGPTSLETGDAIQGSFIRSHRLRRMGEGPAEVIVVATHVLDIATHVLDTATPR